MAFDNQYFEERTLNSDQRIKMQKNDYLWLKRNSKLLKSVTDSKSMSFLDVGCSNGEFLNLFKENKQASLYGIEINKRQFELAKINEIEVFPSLLDFVCAGFKPNMIILRGSCHYMTKCDLEKIFSLGAEEVVFLQCVNFESWFLKYIGYQNFHFIYPSKNHLDVVNSHTLSGVKNLAQIYGYDKWKTSYPYFSTPYRDIPKDFSYALIAILNRNLFNTDHQYTRAFMNNIYRCIFRKVKVD
jgi:SAM-dependent methyltransferase